MLLITITIQLVLLAQRPNNQFYFDNKNAPYGAFLLLSTMFLNIKKPFLVFTHHQVSSILSIHIKDR
jgi:hypothetical protein